MLDTDPMVVIHNIILENDAKMIRKNLHKINLEIDLLVKV